MHTAKILRRWINMTTISIHYCFPGFAFADHWETFDTVDVARVIRDAERDSTIDMYVVGGIFRRKA